MKTFISRCTLLEGKYIDPNIVEIVNVDDPLEVYPAGHNQFKVNQKLTEDDFYLEPMTYYGENYIVAFRK